MKRFRLLPLLVFFYSCKAQVEQPELKINKDSNSLLWQISGNGLKHPSYLFGTFHLMCKSDIHFSEQLTTALSRANEVYMEMDMDDPATTFGGLLFMNMKDGKTLEQLYTPEEYKRVAAFFKDSVSMPLTMLQRMKPFFLEALLYPKMMPCKTISGVEEELMKIAKTQKKEIKGFETIQFQASVFDSIPYTEQAKELLNSIDSTAANKNIFDTMINIYKEQRLNKMEDLFNKTEAGLQTHQDILLDNRNENWVLQLKKIMQEGSVFIAVGAGHLVAPKGLIKLLTLQGYTLKPLFNK